MKFAKFTLGLAAVVFFLYGLAFAIAPAMMFAWATGGELTSAASLVDVRSTYGGLSIAVGVALAYLYRQDQIAAGLTIFMYLLLCMASTRLLGFVVDGGTSPIMIGYFVSEILGAVWMYAALRSLPATT